MKRRADPSAARSGSKLAAVLLAVLPLIYVLSYAPLYRWINGSDLPMFNSSGYRPRENTAWEAPYQPLLFLTHQTPLGTPLLWWADVWSVRRSMIGDRIVRTRGPGLFVIP